MSNSKEIELAWAAGFWDGEGYSGLVRIKNKKAAMRPIATVAQTDIRVLERFKNAVGLGQIRGPYQPSNPNASPSYQWSSGGTFTRLLKMYECLSPYLSDVKLNQMKDVLDAYADYQINTKYCKGKDAARAYKKSRF